LQYRPKEVSSRPLKEIAMKMRTAKKILKTCALDDKQRHTSGQVQKASRRLDRTPWETRAAFWQQTARKTPPRPM
jgi:hypothetical protein